MQRNGGREARGGRGAECRGSVSAVELGARQDSAGKASTVCVDCRDGERQTQHTQWLEGRQHSPRVVGGGGVEERRARFAGLRSRRTLLIAGK